MYTVVNYPPRNFLIPKTRERQSPVACFRAPFCFDSSRDTAAGLFEKFEFLNIMIFSIQTFQTPRKCIRTKQCAAAVGLAIRNGAVRRHAGQGICVPAAAAAVRERQGGPAMDARRGDGGAALGRQLGC